MRFTKRLADAEMMNIVVVTSSQCIADQIHHSLRGRWRIVFSNPEHSHSALEPIEASIEAEKLCAVLFEWTHDARTCVLSCEDRFRNFNIPLIAICSGSALDRVSAKSVIADATLDLPFNPLEFEAEIIAFSRRSSQMWRDTAMSPFDQSRPHMFSAASRNQVKDAAMPGSHESTAKVISIDHETRRVIIDGIDVKLTPREFTLFNLLFDRMGRCCTRDDIFDSWGVELDIVTNQIDFHICNLRRKLKSARLGHIIHTVSGRGYIVQHADDFYLTVP